MIILGVENNYQCFVLFAVSCCVQYVHVHVSPSLVRCVLLYIAVIHVVSSPNMVIPAELTAGEY